MIYSLKKNSRVLLMLLIAFLSVLNRNNALAQRNYTMYGLSHLGQAHYLNPAFTPDANIYISLPLGMQSFGVSNSGFNLRHLLHSRPQDDSLVFDAARAVDKMGKRNFLTAESYNELLAFGFRIKDNYFSFSATNRLTTNFIYTDDLFRLALEGNGKSYLGKRANLGNIGYNLNSYMEYAIGYNRKVNAKLSVGGRIKFLSGIMNVNTKKTRLGLYTDAETFDLTLDGSASINSSGIKPFYDTLAPDNYNPLSNSINFKNFGIALDLGGTYKLNEKISLSASVLDIGFIRWKTDNANFDMKDINYTFDGVNLNQFLKDSVKSVTEQLKDTLNNIFTGSENAESYKTGLNTRFYIGGTYKLTNYFTAGFTLYNEIIKSRYRAAVIVSGNLKLNSWLGVTLNYSTYARSYGNIGLGLSLRGGPIQFFVATDNVLAFMAPQRSKNFHLSTGLNLMIGKPNKTVEKSAKFE